jgi:hypothetical protein
VPEPSDSSAAEFRRRLGELGIPAVLIGALAANRYRQTPRLTTDIDFLARSLSGLAETMAREGFRVDVVSEPGAGPYLVFLRRAGLAVDVMLAETDYQHEAMDRAVDGVITAEDVIVHKLLAWRDRDRDDIASILAVGHDLDEGYIARWAAAWDVTDRWDRAIRDFGSNR